MTRRTYTSEYKAKEARRKEADLKKTQAQMARPCREPVVS